MKKLIILLGVLGVSCSAILVRLSQAPSMVLVFYRMLFASVILLPWSIMAYRSEWKTLSRKTLLLSLLSGVFLGFHFTCYFSALRYTSIASAVVLVDTEVFFVALAAPLLLDKRVSRRGWIGILLTFLGSILIAAADANSGNRAGIGSALALLGAFCMAVYTLIGAKVRRTCSTTVYTTLVYTAGTVTVGLLLLLSGTPVIGYAPRDYAAALGLSLFCTLLGHSVFSWGLKYESPAYVSTVKLLEPVFATLLGLALFREIPTLPVILGGVIVIAGIAWYSANSDSP